MPLTPVVIDQFPGLSYETSRVGAAGAFVAHNVLIRYGRLMSRPPVQSLGETLVGAPTSIHCLDGSTEVIISESNILRAFSVGVSTDTESVTVNSGGARYADVGTSSSNLTYIVNLSSAIRTFDGSAFATPSYTGVTPSGAIDIAVTPWDNRVVYVGHSNASRVYFSDPGVPTTVQTNNYVDLTPGDGESIRRVVAWRDLVFVFKTTKFFVFYGTSTSSTGTPIFNYRTVDGVGVYGTSSAGPLATAHRDGVYFAGTKMGLYRTTGGVPVDVSRDIRRLAQGAFNPNYGFTFGTATGVGCDDRYVYMASSDESATFVYDTESGLWTSASFALGGAFGQGGVASRTNQFLYFTEPNEVICGAYGQGSIGTGTTDAHTSLDIDAYYQPYWLDLGSPGVEKEIRDTVVHGSGSILFKWLRDYENSGTTSADQSLTLGTILNRPQLAHTRKAVRGALFSPAIANSAGAQFDIDRLEVFVREVRPAGNRTA